MERMLVVKFGSEHAAYEAADALEALSEVGVIGLNASAVITRKRMRALGGRVTRHDLSELAEAEREGR